LGLGAPKLAARRQTTDGAYVFVPGSNLKIKGSMASSFTALFSGFETLFTIPFNNVMFYSLPPLLFAIAFALLNGASLTEKG